MTLHQRMQVHAATDLGVCTAIAAAIATVARAFGWV